MCQSHTNCSELCDHSRRVNVNRSRPISGHTEPLVLRVSHKAWPHHQLVMSAVVSGCLPLRLPSVCCNGHTGGQMRSFCHPHLFVLWRRNVLLEGEVEEWTVALECCEIQTLVNEQGKDCQFTGLTSSHNHFFLSWILSPFSLVSFCLSFFSFVFLFLICYIIWHLVILPLVILHPFFYFLLHLYFVLPFSLSVNRSTFAASGTKRTTLSPGTSSIRPISTRWQFPSHNLQLFTES